MVDAPRLDDDRTVLAAEFALGLAEGDELDEAQRLLLSDGLFATMVEWWQYQFATLSHDFADVSPPPSIWPSIARRLTGQDNFTQGGSARSFGQRAAMLALLLVGSLGMFLLGTQFGGRENAVDEDVTVEAPDTVAQLVASLTGAEGSPVVAVRVDPAAATLNVEIAGIPAEQRVEGTAPELWVVPAGGAPVSLGLLPQDGGTSRILSASERELIQEGALFAVTYESEADAPHAAPTTDIVASGQILKV